MRLRYTLRAARQIERALADIAAQSPQGATNVRDRILAIAILLQQHPRAGHPTSRPGVRRITVTPHPYLIDYRGTDEEIIISASATLPADPPREVASDLRLCTRIDARASARR